MSHFKPLFRPKLSPKCATKAVFVSFVVPKKGSGFCRLICALQHVWSRFHASTSSANVRMKFGDKTRQTSLHFHPYLEDFPELSESGVTKDSCPSSLCPVTAVS